jgi:hypothetical protein
MGIKVRKERARDYTFIDDGLDLRPAEKEGPLAKKGKARDFGPRGDKVSKLKKSKISGGHSMQGHSPVYE